MEIGGRGGGNATWHKLRIGADPPEALVDQLDKSTAEVYAVAGLNPAIFRDAQGTAAREAWRQALHGVVAPLGRLFQHELSFKLDAPDLSIDWTELRASDIMGRARAFQSMVGGGMEPERAAALAGLMESPG